MLLDEKHGRDAMFEFARHRFSWLGRPVELPGSRPLRFEFSQDIGSQLVEWPVDHCIKCLCFYHPDDPDGAEDGAAGEAARLFEAARKVGRELLVEIIAGKHGTLDDDTIPRALEELYALGIKPDWWKLEPQASRGRLARDRGGHRRSNDPWCRGVVLLGLEAPQDELERAFAATAGTAIVKGFAVGRTIFAEPRRALAGRRDRRRGGHRRHGRALRQADRGLACGARPERGIVQENSSAREADA